VCEESQTNGHLRQQMANKRTLSSL
jgi:hypothetical protein